MGGSSRIRADLSEIHLKEAGHRAHAIYMRPHPQFTVSEYGLYFKGVLFHSHPHDG